MVLWYHYALGSAIFTGLAAVVTKKTLLKEHAMEFSTVLAIFNFFVSLLMINYVNFAIPLDMIVLMYIASVFGAIAFLYTAKAIRHMEISVSSPLMNFNPAILAVLALVFLGEALSLSQIGGILLLIAGAYVLEVDHKISDLKEPIKKMFKSKYVHYIFIAMVLYAFSSVLDKIILSSIDAFTYLVVIQLFLAVNFIIMIYLFHDGWHGIKHGIQSAGKWILLVAVLTTSYRLLQAQATTMAYVSLVVTVKRMGSLFAVIIGGEMFHEKGLRLKILASVIMIVGMYFVIV